MSQALGRRHSPSPDKEWTTADLLKGAVSMQNAELCVYRPAPAYLIKKKTLSNDLAHLNFKYLHMISIPSSFTLLFILASRFEEEGDVYFMAIRTGS